MKNFPLKIILIISCALLTSCCKELWFEKEETFWTDVYEKGDVIIFKSNLINENHANYTDTIFILNKTEYTPSGNCNPLASNVDPQGCVIDYKYKHGSIMSGSDLFVQHFKKKKGKSYPILRVYGTEFSQRKLKDTSIVLNTMGVKLNDCFAFHGSREGWPKFKLKTFVWSKKMGLVMFIGYNGEKFEFLKKMSPNE